MEYHKGQFFRVSILILALSTAAVGAWNYSIELERRQIIQEQSENIAGLNQQFLMESILNDDRSVYIKHWSKEIDKTSIAAKSLKEKRKFAITCLTITPMLIIFLYYAVVWITKDKKA